MIEAVRYSTRWNARTRRPIARHDWIDAAQAKELYERHEFFDIVDAVLIQNDLPFPRWVISSSHGFVVRIFDQELSIVREIEYKHLEGQLFCSAIVEHGFSDGRQQWMRIRVRPDGSGVIRTRRSGPEGESVEEFTGLDVGSLWLPCPEFGDWTSLTNSRPTGSEFAERVGAS